jgi:hypothetical protein
MGRQNGYPHPKLTTTRTTCFGLGWPKPKLTTAKKKTVSDLNTIKIWTPLHPIQIWKRVYKNISFGFGQLLIWDVTYMLVYFLFILIFRMSCYKFMIFWIRLLVVLSMYSFLCIIALFFVMKKQKNRNLALLHLGLYIKHLLLHHFPPLSKQEAKAWYRI